MVNSDARPPRKFRHVFLDAEGTLYVPKGKRSRWEFWADPTPEAAVDFFELDERVAETLKSLRDQVDTLCIVSRNTEPILRAILRKHNIERCFDDILLNGNKGKMIETYLRKRGLSKSESVMVGDMPTLDLYPVRRVGVDAILVDRHYNRFARAERIKGIKDLPAWLKIADMVEDMKAKAVRIASLDEYLAPGGSEDDNKSARVNLSTQRLMPVAGA